MPAPALLPRLRPRLRWAEAVTLCGCGCLVALFRLSPWWLLLLAALGISHCLRTSLVARRELDEWLQREAHRYRLVQAAGLSVPASLDFSTTEKCIWLATVIEQLWPYAKVGLEHMMRENLDPILAQVSASSSLASLKFRQLQLGQRAPLITGVNTLRTAAGVSVDLTVQLTGGSDVIIDAATAAGITLSAELTDLTVGCTIRITFAALSPHCVPGFKALNVTCVKKPEIGFNLSAVEIPLTQIPGLSDAITHAVQEGVASAIVWPWSVSIPLFSPPDGLSETETNVLNDRSGEGVLRVVVVSADNLQRPTTFRLPSPYVVCTLNGAKPQRTVTVTESENPVWPSGEGSTFEWVVHDWASATFECDVQDIGIMTRIVKSLGKASLDLASLRPFVQQPFRLSLPMGGYITLQMEYQPFATFNEGYLLPDDAVADLPESAAISTAFLYVEVLGCSGEIESEVQVCVQCAGQVHKTDGTFGMDSQALHVGESFSCPVKSLRAPASVYVEDFRGDTVLGGLGGRARIELVDGSGRLCVGSTPWIQSIELDGGITISVKLALKLPLQIPLQPSTTESGSDNAPHADTANARYEMSDTDDADVADARQLFRDVIGFGGPQDIAVCASFISLFFSVYVTVCLFRGTWLVHIILAVVVTGGTAILFHSDLQVMLKDWLQTELPPQSFLTKGCSVTGPLQPEEQAVLLTHLPQWLSQPDAEKSEWFNDILTLLWPTLRQSMESAIERALDLDGREFHLDWCSVGSAPPAVTSIKCYPQTVRGSNVLIDLSLIVGGDIGMQVSYRAGLIRIPLTLNDLYMKCDVRFEMGPPVAHVPPIAGIKISLVQPHNFDIDCNISLAGLRITSLPGVATVIKKLVLRYLLRSLYMPQGLKIPFGTVSVSTADQAHGIGLLRVHVRRAIGLPQQAATLQSAIGLASTRPSCVAEVHAPKIFKDSAGMQRATTCLATNAVNPEWDERLEILVPSSGAVLQLSVMGDALLGKARGIDIEGELKPNALTQCATALSTIKGSVGTLQVDLEWKPFVEHFVPRAIAVQEDFPRHNWSVGVIFVSIVGCQNLEDHSSLSHVRVTVGGETKRTRSRKGASPDFNTDFHFPIQYVPQQKVRVQVIEHRAGGSHGDVKFNVSDVVHSGGKLAGTWDLHGSDHVKIELALHFRGVSLEEAQGNSLFVRHAAEYTAPPPTPPPPSSRGGTPALTLAASPQTSIIQNAGLNLVAAGIGVAWSRIAGDPGSPRTPNSPRVGSPLRRL